MLFLMEFKIRLVAMRKVRKLKRHMVNLAKKSSDNMTQLWQIFKETMRCSDKRIPC